MVCFHTMIIHVCGDAVAGPCGGCYLQLTDLILVESGVAIVVVFWQRSRLGSVGCWVEPPVFLAWFSGGGLQYLNKTCGRISAMCIFFLSLVCYCVSLWVWVAVGMFTSVMDLFGGGVKITLNFRNE